MWKRKRDLYLVRDAEENVIYAHGVEFRDFVQALPEELNHVLLLQSGSIDGETHLGSMLDYSRRERLDDLLNEDVSRYGNFCWVDFEALEAMDRLEPQELAELLYLGHMKKPVLSPFFDTLGNRFAYLAHDDGWYLKLYLKEMDLFVDVLAKLIPRYVRVDKRRKVLDVSHEVSRQLMNWADDGLFFDLGNKVIENGRIVVPIYVVGKVLDFDRLLNNEETYKENARVKARLVYQDHRWHVEMAS